MTCAFYNFIIPGSYLVMWVAWTAGEGFVQHDWVWLQGVALTKVPKIKYLIIIGGAKFKSESVAEKAYSSPIQCSSLHFLGETDFLRPNGLELLESCLDPVVIHHPQGHTIPRFGRFLYANGFFWVKLAWIFACSSDS
ncbi:Serine hydrolase FSH - like 5 [Theobroma cacao]|nr:Serine hydrolase FSH - like 5 [Theobroma cacao]